MAYGVPVSTTSPTESAVPGGISPPRRGPFTRWPRLSDAVLAAGLFLLIVFVTFEEPDQDVVIRTLGDIPILELVLIAVTCAALWWRRSVPLLVLGVALGAVSLAVVFDAPETVGFAMLVALYSAGRYATDDRWSYAALGATLLVAVITNFVTDVPITDYLFAIVVLSGIWYLGRRVRFRGERAAQLERERAAEAGRLVAEERTRIARELHDIVAHQVTLMTVQAGAAKTVAADDPEAALRAMQAVETTGRQALGELRHLLGVLRPDAERNGLGPQPGLADVPGLVDQFREAGLPVTLTIDGVPAEVSTGVDVSAYRIVQEALTNVLKHAGPSARTEVRLGGDDGAVLIEVLDAGSGASALPGSGHGIVGMRERATLLGGSLDAGPRPGGGYRVFARLPTEEATA